MFANIKPLIYVWFLINIFLIHFKKIHIPFILKKWYKLKFQYDMHLLIEMRVIVTKGWTSSFKVTQVGFASTFPLALIPKGRIGTRLVTTTSVISRITSLFYRRTEIIFLSREQRNMISLNRFWYFFVT